MILKYAGNTNPTRARTPPLHTLMHSLPVGQHVCWYFLICTNIFCHLHEYIPCHADTQRALAHPHPTLVHPNARWPHMQVYILLYTWICFVIYMPMFRREFVVLVVIRRCCCPPPPLLSVIIVVTKIEEKTEKMRRRSRRK